MQLKRLAVKIVLCIFAQPMFASYLGMLHATLRATFGKQGQNHLTIQSKHNMKKFFIAILLALPTLAASAQSQKGDSQYLAGAVPVVDGYVQFSDSRVVEGKTQSQIFEALKKYTQSEIVEGPDHLPQARITEADSLTGTIAASIDEYLYFKRTNWQIHRVHFYYQLIFQAKEGGYTATMRNLHYKYDPEVTAGKFQDDYRAEKWITDDAALTKNGTKLARISGKFRVKTIDRKNEIFRGAANAAGVKKTYKIVEVEE